MKGPTRHATNSTANLTETPRRHKPTKLGIISAKSFRAQLYMDVPTSPSSSSRRKFRWKRGGERLDGDLSEHSHRGRRPRSKSPIGSIRRSLRRSRDDSDLKLRTMSPIGRRLRRHVKDDIDVESPLPSVTRQNILHKMNPFSQRKGDNRGSDESNGEGFGSEAGESNHTSSFEARDRRGKRMTADESVLDYVRPEAVSPNRDLPNRNVSFDTQNTAAEDLGYETMSGFTDDLTADGPEVTRAQYGKPTAKKHRIRPYHCFDPPLFMTEEELYTDSMEPSVSFEHLQSFLAPSSPSAKALSVPESVSLLYDSPATDGRIGSLRVEVLGCVSLNRNKPDVAVYMVCGDSAFSTDVLHGYRSPMWPSASKRAAIFPIHHAFARLYIGVFDVKVRKNKENDVFCGRVAIDISSLRPETEYDATLPLRASTFIYDRRKRGVIRLRFSLYWFSERSAALSYFRKPVSLVESCPLVGGAPVIPCAEPKTFRNVAVAVHGQDLPGKYSRGAFRATMREFNLYQTNLRYLIKTLVLDAILYESPLVSLYLFCASLHCVTVSSMRWVPPYVVGYIIILLFKNYWFYVENEEYNCGYQPLTMWEVFNAVVYDNKHHESKFESISVAKRAKRRANKKAQNLGRVESGGEDDEKEVLAVDHHEFPFSDRVTYPRFGVEHALAPSSKKKNSNKGGSSRLHGRLSVYYTSAPPSGVEDAQDDESSEGDHSEEETMMTDGIEDNMFPLDMEGDDEDEIMDEQITTQGKTTSGIFDQGAASAVRRLKVGPAQNADTSSNNKVPPQIHLKKMENLLHKFTHKVSVQPVMAPETDVTRERNRRTSLALNTADLQAQAREKKRATYDEFDKLLGMDTRTANPVVRIMSAFLGKSCTNINYMSFSYETSRPSHENDSGVHMHCEGILQRFFMAGSVLDFLGFLLFMHPMLYPPNISLADVLFNCDSSAVGSSGTSSRIIGPPPLTFLFRIFL